MVKPRCSEILTYPDFFAPDTDWLYWCKPDFSDFEEVAAGLLTRLDGLDFFHRYVLTKRLHDQLHPLAGIEFIANKVREVLKA